MGNAKGVRTELARRFFESGEPETTRKMRDEGIDYILIPKTHKNDFPYVINREFYRTAAKQVFDDAMYEAYQL